MARGTGKTTRQMRALPQGALFVWCNDRLEYPIALRAFIGRMDLRIVGPQWFDGHAWEGCRFSAVVIDHALQYNAKIFHIVSLIKARCHDQ